ncbi:MAG TPA: cytochrome c3 family protein [Bacteroidota bacterium]|nr:cytochrome c3 family protein [Bacteroidota bacterium]
MKRHLRIIRLLFLAAICCSAHSDGNAQDQCLTCHETLGDGPAVLFRNDIHREKGVSCADCHGGDRTADDMEKAMAPAAGFAGVPKGDDVTRMCAGCHASAAVMVNKYKSDLPWDQQELLAASVHGKGSVSGKESIVQCATCHNAHGVVPVDNVSSPVYPLNVTKTCGKCHSNPSYMRTYNPALPVDQVEKYRTSVHGKRNAKGDRKVAECASCHGGHEIRSAKDVKSRVYPWNIPATCGTCHADARYMKGYGIASDQLDEYSKSVHGVALLEKSDIGAPACNDCHGNHAAAPPGVESVSHVCGTCHALNAELFATSPHKKAFDSANMPECETCHGNHEILAASEKLLGVSEEAVCSWCHGGEPESKAYQVASTMRTLADSLEQAEKGATALVNEAEQKGMEITDAKFKLRDARQARLESRTMVHSFDIGKFREVIDNGVVVTAVVTTEARIAIEEYYFRRWGLAIATFIMTALSVLVYVYVKRLEKHPPDKKDVLYDKT